MPMRSSKLSGPARSLELRAGPAHPHSVRSESMSPQYTPAPARRPAPEARP